MYVFSESARVCACALIRTNTVFSFPPGVYVGTLNLIASIPSPSIFISNGRILRAELDTQLQFEPVHEKTNNLGFRPGSTQTGLYSHRRWLEGSDQLYGYREADLRLCFRLSILLVFLHGGSLHVIIHSRPLFPML